MVKFRWCLIIIANAKVEVRDIQGEPLRENRSNDGLINLIVNSVPIYVAGVPADVSLTLLPKAPRKLRKAFISPGGWQIMQTSRS
jgi:hypothetical protein